MDELLTKRRDVRQESLHLRLQQQSGQLEQPSRTAFYCGAISPELKQSYRRRGKQTQGK